MSLPKRELSLAWFVRERSLRLIGRVEEQMALALEAKANEHSVHDLRTSIRRLGECLRTFQEVFPGGEARTIRRNLKKLMDRAAEVRNRDISSELFRKSGVTEEHPLLARLHLEQDEQKRLLLGKLETWTRKKRPDRWRKLLQRRARGA